MVEATRQLADHAQAALDAAGAGLDAASAGAVDPFIFHLAIFALAVFVGATLARPTTTARRGLLSAGAIAISSVVIVGALISVGVDASVAGEDGPLWTRLFGFIALALAAASVVGGFIIAGRMLATHGKKG